MKNVLIIISILCFANAAYAQIKVVDSKTQEGIPYVAIAFDEKNGLYTNDVGEFELDQIVGDSIHLSSIGYKSKTVVLNSIKNKIIYLTPDEYQLAEIIISNKKIKGKTKKVKPIKHNDFLKSHRLLIGEEMAIYIPNNFDSNSDIELKSILIPIVTKTISFDKSLNGKKQRVKKLKFSGLYRISFYENDNGKPGKQFDYENCTIVINEKRTVVKLNLDDFDVELPKNGLFVGVQNLGETDENNNLISETPFILKETKKGVVKIVRPTKPYFPVHYNTSKHETFYRYIFGNDKKWKPFFKHGKVRKGEFHNVSLGYELTLY